MDILAIDSARKIIPVAARMIKLVSGDISLPPNKKTTPIASLNPAIACAGAFAKDSDIGASIMIWRNSDAE